MRLRCPALTQHLDHTFAEFFSIYTGLQIICPNCDFRAIVLMFGGNLEAGGGGCPKCLYKWSTEEILLTFLKRHGPHQPGLPRQTKTEAAMPATVPAVKPLADCAEQRPRKNYTRSARQASVRARSSPGRLEFG